MSMSKQFLFLPSFFFTLSLLLFYYLFFFLFLIFHLFSPYFYFVPPPLPSSFILLRLVHNLSFPSIVSPRFSPMSVDTCPWGGPSANSPAALLLLPCFLQCSVEHGRQKQGDRADSRGMSLSLASRFRGRDH